MIVVDVDKQSVTAVAVEEAGRMLDEWTVAVGSEELDRLGCGGLTGSGCGRSRIAGS